MLKFAIILSVFILLVSGVIYFVFRSPFFQITGLETTGSQRTEEIKGELIGFLLKTSNFRFWLGPENLLFWSPQNQKAPPSLFWLSNLNWARDWQQKKITIDVKERQPWLLWCLQTQTDAEPAPTNTDNLPRQSAIKKCYWLDEQGLVFSLAPEAEGFIVPKVFEENGRQQLILGQPFYDNPQLVKNTLEIIKQFQKSSLAVNRFLINDINLEELETETNGLKLYFGLRFLPQNLNGILTDLASRLDFPKLEYVDFRVENRIYYK